MPPLARSAFLGFVFVFGFWRRPTRVRDCSGGHPEARQEPELHEEPQAEHDQDGEGAFHQGAFFSISSQTTPRMCRVSREMLTTSLVSLGYVQVRPDE